VFLTAALYFGGVSMSVASTVLLEYFNSVCAALYSHTSAQLNMKIEGRCKPR
jgi:hypothetical protein